jgi:hypothetical protein
MDASERPSGDRTSAPAPPGLAERCQSGLGANTVQPFAWRIDHEAVFAWSEALDSPMIVSTGAREQPEVPVVEVVGGTVVETVGPAVVPVPPTVVDVPGAEVLVLPPGPPVVTVVPEPLELLQAPRGARATKTTRVVVRTRSRTPENTGSDYLACGQAVYGGRSGLERAPPARH